MEQRMLRIATTAIGAVVLTLAGGLPVAAQDNEPLSRLDEIPGAVANCLRRPEDLQHLEEIGVTARFSLKRDGTLMGPPRVTFATLPHDTRARELLTEATVEGIARCTPLNLSRGLGEAVAGRPVSVFFVYKGSKGTGA
jgi:hypothetical protein